VLGFADKAFGMLTAFVEGTERYGAVEWVGPVLQIADALMKYEGEDSLRWAELLAGLV
jgi:hypothetical protein